VDTVSAISVVEEFTATLRELASLGYTSGAGVHGSRVPDLRTKVNQQIGFIEDIAIADLIRAADHDPDVVFTNEDARSAVGQLSTSGKDAVALNELL
jgi:hypothetical protein